MQTFTDIEVEYLNGQSLGRLATVGSDGVPHNVPVGAFYDPDTETIAVGCVQDMTATKKYRDIVGHPEVAFVVDDLATVEPWAPRGVEIRGRAEAVMSGGEQVGKRLGAGFPFDTVWIRVHPHRVVSWGLDSERHRPYARDVGEHASSR